MKVSKQMLKTALASVMASALLAACATAPDAYLLGAATKENIARHSVRNVNLPNSDDVADASGVRAVRAIQELNTAKPKKMAESGIADAGAPR